MPEIRNNAVDQRTFETNAQMLGAQRDTVRRKDLAKSASSREDGETEADHVELGQHGQEAGTSQNLAEQAQRLAATRQAMAGGTIQSGDVAPGAPAAAQGSAESPAPAAESEQGPAPAAASATKKAASKVGPAAASAQAASGVNPAGTGGDSPLTKAAQRAHAAQQDAEQAQAIYTQMAAERQKTLAEMWKIFQDLQTAIFQKMQEVMIYRQQVMDKISAKWSEVLRGAG